MKKNSKKSATTGSLESKFKPTVKEKRNVTLYVRLKKVNMDFIAGESHKAGISEALYVDQVFDHMRAR